MSDDFTLDEMIREARRELVLRQQVYPRLIATGKMDARDGARRIGIMKAIIRTLEDRRRERGRDDVQAQGSLIG